MRVLPGGEDEAGLAAAGGSHLERAADQLATEAAASIIPSVKKSAYIFLKMKRFFQISFLLLHFEGGNVLLFTHFVTSASP